MTVTNIKTHAERSASAKATNFFCRFLGMSCGADGVRESPLSGEGGGVAGFSLAAGTCFSEVEKVVGESAESVDTLLGIGAPQDGQILISVEEKGSPQLPQ